MKKVRFYQNADGPTGKVASVMPYYSVSWNVDKVDGENVGNSYSHYIINDLLREKYGYDGVVCTDWGITQDQGSDVDEFGSRCFGVEHLTEAERHLRIIENGVDQFGGNSNIVPILEAYELGCKKHGEEWMRNRFDFGYGQDWNGVILDVRKERYAVSDSK